MDFKTENIINEYKIRPASSLMKETLMLKNK